MTPHRLRAWIHAWTCEAVADGADGEKLFNKFPAALEIQHASKQQDLSESSSPHPSLRIEPGSTPAGSLVSGFFLAGFADAGLSSKAMSLARIARGSIFALTKKVPARNVLLLWSCCLLRQSREAGTGEYSLSDANLYTV